MSLSARWNIKPDITINKALNQNNHQILDNKDINITIADNTSTSKPIVNNIKNLILFVPIYLLISNHKTCGVFFNLIAFTT